jgi:hypothetical protein
MVKLSCEISQPLQEILEKRSRERRIDRPSRHELWDLGLTIVSNLDGEMTVLEGASYQVCKGTASSSPG